MMYRTSDPTTDDAVVADRGASAHVSPWSPLQIIGLIVGIGFAALGIASIARTGFDTSHIYTPHLVVWHLPQSPLMGLIEIAFGALLVLASVPAGGARSVIMFLGAASLAFGIVVLVEAMPNRLNHWLAVDHGNGWLFTIVGAVLVLAALLMPVFSGSATRRRVRRIEPVSADR
jgi:hypothetical protein